MTSEARAEPIRVLFVCTANICRSAYTEVLARHLLGPGADVVVASAGTYGLPAHPMNPDMAEFLPAGVSPDGFASRGVTAEIVREADLILTMEAAHRGYLLDEFPATFRKALTLGQFAEAARGASSRGRELVNEVARQRPPVRAGDDVADPYRRGREANARAAEQITALLEVVLEGLTGAPADN